MLLLQTIDHSRERVDNSNLRVTVDNDQYYTSSSLHSQSIRPAYRPPQPVPPPVTQVVQQTGRFLSQIDNWNPVSLQPRRDLATSVSQSAPGQPQLVNISNSKYATLDASSSLAQKLLKNIDLLGKAFSSSTVTYNPVGSITAASGSTLQSTPYFASSTDHNNRMSVSPSHAVSSEQESVPTGDRFSLKFRQPATSNVMPSKYDPVIADVLKSIGFNVDLSRFGSTKAQEHKSHTGSMQHSSISDMLPRPVPPVQDTNPVLSPLNASAGTEHGKSSERKTFSEINKMLQKVREYRESKQQRSRPPVKEQVRSRSRHRSSSSTSSLESRESDRKYKKPLQKKQRPEPRKRETEGSERRSGRGVTRDKLRQRASPLPRRHDRRRSLSPKRGSESRRHSSLSPRRRKEASPSPRRRRPASPSQKLPYNLYGVGGDEKHSSIQPSSRRKSRAKKASKTSSISPPTSSRQLLRPDVHGHYFPANPAVPLMPPPHLYYPYGAVMPPMPVPAPIPWKHFPVTTPKQKHDDWKKSTEEFLRRLGAPCDIEAKIDDDLSSVSSDSMDNYISDKVADHSSKLPQKREEDKSSTTVAEVENGREHGHSEELKPRDKTETDKLPSSADRRTSTVKSSSKTKVVCELDLLNSDSV